MLRKFWDKEATKMSFKNILISITFLLVILYTSGCQDLITKTQIYPNGSCERTIIVDADSTGIQPYAYPLPLDTSWTSEYNPEDEDKLLLKKTFRKVSELNAELAETPDSTIKIEVKLHKRFRWFYTFLRYEETFKPYSPFSIIPLSDSLTEKEIKDFHAGIENDEIDDRIEAWMQANVIEEIYAAVIESLKEANHPALTIDVMNNSKDIFNSTLIEDDLDINSLDELVYYILELCEGYYGSKTVWDLEKQFRPKAKVIWDKLNFIEDLWTDHYDNYVTMPGLILDTNSEAIDGNNVSWEPVHQNFLIKEYTMWVESRVVNRWALVITGIVVSISLILLIVALFRSRKI